MSELDARLFRLVHDALSGTFVLFAMAVLTVIGSGWSMLALLPILVSPRSRRFGAALLGVLVSTSAVVFVVKHLVGPARIEQHDAELASVPADVDVELTPRRTRLRGVDAAVWRRRELRDPEKIFGVVELDLSRVEPARLESVPPDCPTPPPLTNKGL